MGGRERRQKKVIAGHGYVRRQVSKERNNCGMPTLARRRLCSCSSKRGIARYLAGWTARLERSVVPCLEEVWWSRKETGQGSRVRYKGRDVLGSQGARALEVQVHRDRRCSTAGRFLWYRRKVEGRQQPREDRTRLHMRKGTNMDGQGSSTKPSSYRRKSLGNWRWEMGERGGRRRGANGGLCATSRLSADVGWVCERLPT